MAALAIGAMPFIEPRAGRQPVIEREEPEQVIFPTPERASAEHNTGEVYVALLKESGETMIAHFIFKPGSRNFWHYHPGAEQTLLVLDGEGFYQEEGGEKRLIRKGDVIVTPPNARHWNGATPGRSLVCMTVTEHSLADHAVQLRAVTDAEYGSSAAAAAPVAAGNLVRLSRITVDPAQLDSYNAYLKEEIEASMRLEPGVLTLYATAEKERPNRVTILEIYRDEEAYRQHIQTPHFRKYKQGTLRMVQELELVDSTPLIPGLGIKRP